ncbi:MAG: VOC family protein [Halobacteriovoraceae bacterium]|nr:VOC family protein [Halobacteriovoraceae bacterium]MCB9093487.1 VOC family protein [Halobacteriovoraceae bacterium]
MKINHLIIGCEDIELSKEFYSSILGFKHVNSFVDTGTKKEGYVLIKEQDTELEILLVPFNEERLPSPQHIAFEVENVNFESILKIANDKKLDVRAMPPLDCKIKGVGTTEVRGKKYERFYLLDPSRINIELMRLC